MQFQGGIPIRPRKLNNEVWRRKMKAFDECLVILIPDRKGLGLNFSTRLQQAIAAHAKRPPKIIRVLAASELPYYCRKEGDGIVSSPDS